MESNNITGAEIEHDPFYIGLTAALAGLRWRHLSLRSKNQQKSFKQQSTNRKGCVGEAGRHSGVNDGRWRTTTSPGRR